MRDRVEISGFKVVVIDDPNTIVRFKLKNSDIEDIVLDNSIDCHIEGGKLTVRGAVNPLRIEPDVSNRITIDLKKF